MTCSNFNTWTRLGFLGDGHRCAITWVNMKLAVIVSSVCPTGWAATTTGGMMEPHLHPACASHSSCSSPISLDHTQGTVLTETWAADTGGDVIARPSISSDPSILCVTEVSGCAVTRDCLGFPTDTLICLSVFTGLGQSSWGRKVTTVHLSKQQAVCGFEKKKMKF